MALHTILNTTKDEIDSVLSTPKKNYLRFSIKKRSGKRRIIDAPAPNLKKLQREILDNILYRFIPYPTAHGFAKYRSPKSNAMMHRDAAVVLNVDIKDFFPSINKKRVEGLFTYLNEQSSKNHIDNKFNLKPEDCQTLAALCTHNERVPQGASTSPMLSNLICLGMDKELKELVGKHQNCTITRYADDITISCTDKEFDIGKFIKPISDILHKYGFILNRDKTRILRKHKRQEVTGVVINEGTNAPKAFRRLVRAQVHNFVNAPGFDVLEYRKIRGRIEWISSLNPSHGQQLLNKLGLKKQKKLKTSSSKTQD